MNAPLDPAVLSKPTLRLVQLSWLMPSRTHVQQMRRARFTDEELNELADSIRTNGLVQYPLVRPIEAPSPVSLEIVAGERRFLAAKLAGLTEIYVSVRDLDDNQVLELQLVENLQRKGLHELEEAEGYEELMKLRHINADGVAEMVGRSRSYVYARVKLLALGPELRKAFYAGKVNASEALLFARIPSHKIQSQAVKDLEDAKDNTDVTNFKEAQHFLREHYMLRIADAPFNPDAVLKDASGDCPACTGCRDRTINQPKVFGEEPKGADMCTNTVCFDRKKAAALAARRAELDAKGVTVITGADAKKIKPYEGRGELEAGYIALDEEQRIAGRYEKPRKLLGKAFAGEQLLEDPHTGRLIPIAKAADVRKALEEKGIKDTSRAEYNDGGYAARQKATERKNRIETTARLRMLAEIRAASTDRQFDHHDTLLVAQGMLGRLSFDTKKRLVDVYLAAAGEEKPKGTNDYIHNFDEKVAAMTPAQLGVLMIDMALISDCHIASYYASDAKDLEATARRLGIDPEKIRAEVKAEAKAKAKGRNK